MKDWLKGLIFLVMGNFFYDVIPVWITQYLLSLENPLYSIGLFLQNLPSIRDLTSTSTIGSNLGMIIGVVGIGFIAYALYLFFKRIYRE